MGKLRLKNCDKCLGTGWVYTGKVVWKWLVIPTRGKCKCTSCMGRGKR